MPSIITQFILINESLVINHDCKLSGKDHIKCCSFFQTGISGTGGRIYIKNVRKCIKRKNYAFCKCSIP